MSFSSSDCRLSRSSGDSSVGMSVGTPSVGMSVGRPSVGTSVLTSGSLPSDSSEPESSQVLFSYSVYASTFFFSSEERSFSKGSSSEFSLKAFSQSSALKP